MKVCCRYIRGQTAVGGSHNEGMLQVHTWADSWNVMFRQAKSLTVPTFYYAENDHPSLTL